MMMNPVLFPKRPFAKLFADDGDIGLKVRYVGAQPSATVTVAAGGDITFKHGVAGAEAVDSTIQIGAGAGIIDVSDAAGNTFAEIVDHINGSANWECFLVGSLRADNADASTGSLLARAETTIAPNTDLPLFKDTSKVLNIGIRIGGREKVNQSENNAAAEIYHIISKNTYGSGTSIINIYEIDEVAKTETLVYSKAGGATTAEQTQTFVVDGKGALASSGNGKHLLVKMVGSAACTGYLEVVGAVGFGA